MKRVKKELRDKGFGADQDKAPAARPNKRQLALVVADRAYTALVSAKDMALVAHKQEWAKIHEAALANTNTAALKKTLTKAGYKVFVRSSTQYYSGTKGQTKIQHTLTVVGMEGNMTEEVMIPTPVLVHSSPLPVKHIKEIQAAAKVVVAEFDMRRAAVESNMHKMTVATYERCYARADASEDDE